MKTESTPGQRAAEKETHQRLLPWRAGDIGRRLIEVKNPKRKNKMKKVILIILLSCLASLARADDCNNKLTWRVWHTQFKQTCSRQGITAEGCADFYQQQYQYCQGYSPRQAFNELGCIAEVFSKVWIKRVRALVAHAGVKVSDEDGYYGGEAMNEWLWLEYFTEGKSPNQAARAIIADDPYKKTRIKPSRK